MVARNLEFCRNAIERAAVGAGRDPFGITLVGVTKGIELPLIFEAIDSGLKHIGENRIQEALLKFEPVNAYAKSKGRRIIWHMIGHLQTNKAKDAVRLFELIHSVDSLRLAQEIDREAKKVSKVQDILLEVKTSPETTKFGFPPDEALYAAREILSFRNINVKGLMTIAPAVSDPEQARPYFSRLKSLLDELNRLRISGFGFRILSMGMTGDFEIAIQEGATMVRVGRGIFGERNK